jgi:hypothetical protein
VPHLYKLVLEIIGIMLRNDEIGIDPGKVGYGYRGRCTKTGKFLAKSHFAALGPEWTLTLLNPASTELKLLLT